MKKIRLTRQQKLDIAYAIEKTIEYYKDLIKDVNKGIDLYKDDEETLERFYRDLNYYQETIYNYKSLLSNIYGYSYIDIIRATNKDDFENIRFKETL